MDASAMDRTDARTMDMGTDARTAMDSGAMDAWTTIDASIDAWWERCVCETVKMADGRPFIPLAV
jgi:hypothetical protein